MLPPPLETLLGFELPFEAFWFALEIAMAAKTQQAMVPAATNN